MLHKLYDHLSRKLDAQSVARNMYQCKVLTLKELQSIQSEHCRSTMAAEQLLNFVISQSGNVYGVFMNALKLTGEQHVELYEMIVNNSCKGKSIVFIQAYR